jgi:serine/threonine protein kinase
VGRGLRALRKPGGCQVQPSAEFWCRSLVPFSDPAHLLLASPPCRLFCRRFPFFENAETVKQARLEEVSEAVTNGPIDLEHGSWSLMSPEGVDFIRRCLTRSEKDRITVEDALQHSWFHKHVPKEARLGAVRKLRPAAPAA